MDFLSDDALQAVTGKKQRSAQVKALHAMKFAFEVRPDGMPIVSKKYVEQRLGVDLGAKQTRKVELSLP